MFKDHHYLDSNINKAAKCYIGIWGDEVVAFGAVLRLPSGTIKNGWRGHRTCVLPDFQGMGIGVRFSDAIAQLYIDDGCRYFSRTAHPKMGMYRNNSSLWKPTSKNMKLRVDVTNNKTYNNYYNDNKRVCFSHEYIGGIKNL